MNTTPLTHPIELTPERKEKLRNDYVAFEALADRYRRDPELRNRIDSGDVGSSLVELGINVPSGIDAKIVVNTAETFHIVFPPDPNTDLNEEMLTSLAGGKTAGSAGSAGSASTLGSFGSSLSTAASAGSVGTAGCGE